MYICHRNYNKTGASGKEYNIKRGTELRVIARFIALGSEAVCSTTSEDAYMYFANNDDGNGLERGDLTYAIAYSDRHPNEDNRFRFTEEEIEMIQTDCPQFLRDDSGSIVFNHEFFNADIEELRGFKRKLTEGVNA